MSVIKKIEIGDPSMTLPHKKTHSLKISLFGFFFLFLGLILLDQSTKYWSEKKFLLHTDPFEYHNYFSQAQKVFLIGQDHWLNFSLTYVRNTGAAWGFLGNLPESIRPYFFYVLTAIALIFILYLFFKTPPKNTLYRLGVALIFSGAMGNYIDRVWLNYVIDWIHFDWKIFFWQYDFPVFNVGDCAVVTGAFLLMFDMGIKKKSPSHPR